MKGYFLRFYSGIFFLLPFYVSIEILDKILEFRTVSSFYVYTVKYLLILGIFHHTLFLVLD